MEDLDGMSWSNQDDSWSWRLEETGVFSVKSAYELLEGLVVTDDLWGDEEKTVFENLWKNLTPSKVLAFVWKTFLNRIPTNQNHTLRNVLPLDESTSCVMCNTAEESYIHLFLHCNLTCLVWSKLMWWLDCYFMFIWGGGLIKMC